MRKSVQPRLIEEQLDFSEILEKFENCQATIAIMGMGYVGFPLAIATHAKGFSVIAFDIDESKVESLNKGKSYLKGIDDSEISLMKEEGRFFATSDAQKLKEADALIMCVPTPLTKNREPDLSYVESTAEMIKSQLRVGQLVVLESTTYPGTTSDVIKPILEKSGLKCGQEFFLAYSPEREDPGNGYYSTSSIPKVVGADDEQSQKLAAAFYSGIISKAVPVSSAATAEAVKLTENIFRSVNIALVNELKMVFAKMGVDVWEVIEAAKTKPFGFMPFYPGPGVGGHCIPIDPFYLTWKSREFDMPTRFIELAGQINARMPGYVINRLREGLDRKFQKGLNGSKILMLGIAYKKDVDDMRESPAMIIFERLLECGALVDYHDNYIPVIPHTREHDSLSGIKSISLDKNILKNYDAVVIATGHSDVDYKMVVSEANLIVDTRNVTSGMSGDNIIRA
ncbi:MAG: nucleotide sugar dehydrogenase [Rickettsiales bacterium]